MGRLTARGRGLLVAGVALLGLGWWLAQGAIAAVGVLLVTLPLLGLLSARASRLSLQGNRTITPDVLPLGDEGEVLLTVQNASRLPTGALLVEDAVAESLGQPTRVVLDRMPHRSQRIVRYPIHGLRRGRADVGPLRVAVLDAFGMARHDRAVAGGAEVLVVPRIVPLGHGSGTVSPGGRGDANLRTTASRGDEDLLPREHRPGDDMRRIHWRATARYGELMVRREEQVHDRGVLVILDDRLEGHEGGGAESTFEWAVSASASIALHYLRHGWRVAVATSTGTLLADTAGPTPLDAGGMLRAFALVQLRSGAIVPGVTDALGGTPTATIAVLGRLSDRAAGEDLGPAPGGTSACLLLEPGPAALLRRRGWRVTEWNRATPIDAAWRAVSPERAAPVHA